VGSASDTARDPLLGRVSAFTAACLLVSNMIGTGIFGTTGFMALDLGSPGWILTLWAFGGLFALLGAFAYGELGAALPRSGGEYVYIRAAYGPLCGFLTGWTSLTIGFSAAIAGSAHLFAGHLLELVAALRPPSAAGQSASLGLPGSRVGLALAMVWLLTLVHASSVERGGLLQRTLTVLKVGALVVLVVAGMAIGTGEWGRLVQADQPASPSLQTLLVSFMFVTFSYTGWNAASYIAGEIHAPRRNLPRAMLWGTLTVSALYMLVNGVYLYALPMSALASPPMDLVGHKSAFALFGDAVGPWFTALLVISILGAASAMIWAGPRVYQAMAQDRVFPRWFAGSSTTSGVPVRSILLQSAWASVLIMSGTFESLVLYATFVLVLFTAVAVSAVFVLRHRAPELERPYRVWGYPWTPALYLLISVAILWAALQLRPVESLWGIATVLAGIPFYFWWSRGVGARCA
jgi:APA family basic amino acid/polyamine antiporter